MTSIEQIGALEHPPCEFEQSRQLFQNRLFDARSHADEHPAAVRQQRHDLGHIGRGE